VIIEGSSPAESSDLKLSNQQHHQICSVIKQFAEVKWGTDWIKIPLSRPLRVDSATWLDMAKYAFVRCTVIQEMVRQNLQCPSLIGEELWAACRGSVACSENLIEKVTHWVFFRFDFLFCLDARLVS
jgi:hypothetical protein